MKKISIYIMSLLLAFGASAAYAAEAELTDAVNGVITVSGTAEAGESVEILITNPDYTNESAENDGARQYADTVFADDDGTYKQDIVLNTTSETDGDFSVYVKEGDKAAEELSPIYYASISKKYAAAKLVKANPAIISTDDTKKMFALNTKLYNSISMDSLAKSLVTPLSSFEIPDTDDVDIQNEKLNDFMKIIKEVAVLEAYNEGKAEILYNADKEFEFEDVMNMKTLDATEGITAYSLYSEKLTDTGKQAVLNSLLGNSLSDIESVKRLFVKSVLYNGIANNKDAGYGHIQTYFTRENVCYAENKTGTNTSIEGYLNLSDKNTADYNIKSNASSITMDNMWSSISSYAQSSSSSNSSNSGGGGGGTVAKKDFTVTMPTGAYNENLNQYNTETKEEEIEEVSMFDDVTSKHWAKEAVESLANRGIINGMDDNSFAPDSNLTREQAIELIVKAYGIEDIKVVDMNGGQMVDRTDYTMFNDVIVGEWYSESVFAAYRNGIVNGVADNLFGVGMSITRQDVAVMLYKASQKTYAGGDLSFADSEDVSDYAKEAIGCLSSEHIINGYDDNTFRPKNNITRAEMAQMLYKMLGAEE